MKAKQKKIHLKVSPKKTVPKKPAMKVGQRIKVEDSEEIKKAKKALLRDLKYTYQIYINRVLMQRYLYECSIRDRKSGDELIKYIKAQLIEWGVTEENFPQLKY